MRTTFEQFIAANPTCSKFKNNVDARKIFGIINKRENILKMMNISEYGKPALSVCVKEIEDYCDSGNNRSINLQDEFTRKMIGRMVKSILETYGYCVDKQKDIPQQVCSKYFSTASCYVPTEDSKNFRMIINDDIMEVRKGNEVFQNLHLEFIIEFFSNDSWKTEYVLINGHKYDLKINYAFRTQGNAHLIFFSEGGVWFGLSFDGHKGDMFVNSNPVINQLIRILNVDEGYGDPFDFDINSDTIFSIIQGLQETMEEKIDESREEIIKIREEYTGGSEFIFCGLTSVDHENQKYTYAEDVFYIEEGDVECFLFYFLTKYFNGNMSINYKRPEEDDSHEFEWWGKNYFTVSQIMCMLDDISSSVELLKNDYNRAINLDFAKRFSIFYMTDDDRACYHMQKADAIKKYIGNVINFYNRFVARMKKLLESDPKIQFISVSGP